MKEIMNRIKSPVVIIQLVSIIVTVTTYFFPAEADSIKVVATAITGAISIVASLNNPTDKINF